jgi:hypothetical protein
VVVLRCTRADVSFPAAYLPAANLPAVDGIFGERKDESEEQMSHANLAADELSARLSPSFEESADTADSGKSRAKGIQIWAATGSPMIPSADR